MHTPVWPANRPFYDRHLSAELFTHAWEEGRSMGLGEAVTYALGERGLS